jgi:nucleoprotein TPR
LREELANERAITRARFTEKESEVKDLSLRLTRTVGRNTSGHLFRFSPIPQTDDLAITREALATARTSESHIKIRIDGLTKQLQVAEEKLAVFERKPGMAAAIPNLAVSEEERLRAQVADLGLVSMPLSRMADC